jgi:phenylacetate-coenzyme A ligase PaaK-like adenylate-forming protein
MYWPAESEDRRATLLALVGRYRKTFAWYDKLLTDRKIDKMSLADLPIVDTEILQDHYYSALRTDFRDADAFLTSGTSGGARKRILFSNADREAYSKQRKGIFEKFLGHIRRPAVAVADLGTGHAAASANRVFRELGFDAHDIDFTQPLERHVELLNQWQPAVLFTMPMILERLMAATSSRFGIKKIIVVGDLAPIGWRRSVAAEFNLEAGDVLDVYGSIEMGAIAYLNVETGAYQFHDHILAEVLNLTRSDTADSCRDTGNGILILTSLTRDYFPAARFRTDDVIAGLKTSTRNGRIFQTFDEILGRCGPEFKNGERISQHDIVTAVRETFGAVPFEVFSGKPFEVRIVTENLTTQKITEFRSRLSVLCPDVGQMIKSGLVDDVRVTAIEAKELRSSSGKRIVGSRGLF